MDESTTRGRRFCLRYTGKTFEITMMMFLMLSVMFIPLAVVNLINGIEIEEIIDDDENETAAA